MLVRLHTESVMNNAPDMSQWVLEPDEFEPEDETMTEEEMDRVCQDLLASTQAYQRGEIPMRETCILEDGQFITYWRFIDGSVVTIDL